MKGTTNREKTISKHYWDDEIIGVEPNGDIHLAPGVHRQNYGDWINPYDLESHINLIDINRQRIKRRGQELDIIQTEGYYE